MHALRVQRRPLGAVPLCHWAILNPQGWDQGAQKHHAGWYLGGAAPGWVGPPTHTRTHRVGRPASAAQHPHLCSEEHLARGRHSDWCVGRSRNAANSAATVSRIWFPDFCAEALRVSFSCAFLFCFVLLSPTDFPSTFLIKVRLGLQCVKCELRGVWTLAWSSGERERLYCIVFFGKVPGRPPVFGGNSCSSP